MERKPNKLPSNYTVQEILTVYNSFGRSVKTQQALPTEYLPTEAGGFQREGNA